MNKWFDDFAAKVGAQAARAWFFSACFVIVLIWAPTMFLLDFNTSQLLISTITTVITFLLVALLQNTQDRSTRALQKKLDLILESNAQILDNTDGVDDSGEMAKELRDMAGVEMESQTE